MAQGSYFKGWASNLPNVPTPQSGGDIIDVYIGQVLSVDYKGTDAGKIRVRLIGVSKELNDDDVKVEAYPADLSMVKYPLPGELVMMFMGLQNKIRKNKFSIVFYYNKVLTSNQSITYNGDPNIGQTVPVTKAAQIFTPEYRTRFHSKIKNHKSYFITDEGEDYVVNRGPLAPTEGDVIIQGRFGSSMRLSAADVSDLLSSIDSTPHQWSEKGGKAGDPVIALSVNGTASPTPVREDVNGDGSKFFISSAPTIPVNMAASAMTSLSVTYGFSDKDLAEVDDPINFLKSPAMSPLYFDINTLGSAPSGTTPAELLNLSGAAKLAYQLLIEREGTILEAMWDISNWRIGHGSSTITTENGLVVKLDAVKANWPTAWADKATGKLSFTDIGTEIDTKGQTHGRGKIWKSSMSGRQQQPLITQKEADMDLARRIIEEFLPGARKAVNNDVAWQAIGPGAQAALVSIKYNYGNINAKKTFGSTTPAAVASGGDKEVLANYIQNEMPGGSKERHAVEAQYVRMT